MYENQEQPIAEDYASFARIAENFAYALIILQDVLVLMLLPIYVSSAIPEERENQTLEALFITPLTNWQILLGKFGARFLHLAAVILAGVPLLALMHLWGNVSVAMLAYHFAHTLLLAMSAGSVCMLVSSSVPSS